MNEDPRYQTSEALRQLVQGDPRASDVLFPLLYEELRKIASSRLRGGPGPATLQTTELVHEAYLRLVDQTDVGTDDRAHFCALAAQVMRHILVDRARRRCTIKRGGGGPTRSLSKLDLEAPAISLGEFEILALNEAIEELALLDARQARVVELRNFGGLSREETAAVLNISESTVKREWRVARAWLRKLLADGDWVAEQPSSPSSPSSAS